MQFTMYDASVSAFVRMLSNMRAQLEKAEAYAQARKFDSNNFVPARLAPDMLPFAKQVQIACDAAKLACARLAGIEAPKNDDNEQSLPEFVARVAQTIEFLKTVPREKFEGVEGRDVTWSVRGAPMTLPAAEYLLGYALPTFYFHYTMAYALLRHNGVELGKADYLRGLGG